MTKLETLDHCTMKNKILMNTSAKGNKVLDP